MATPAGSATYFRLENADEIQRMFRECGEVARDAARLEMQKLGRDITRSAVEDHRYVADTHDLEKSIHYRTETSEDNVSLKVFADLGYAPYARRIHQGWGTWAADPFLERPFLAALKVLPDRITAAISRAVKRASGATT